MIAQNLAIFAVAVVFIAAGIANKLRGKGPWVTFLFGGVAMVAMELLSLLGIVAL